ERPEDARWTPQRVTAPTTPPIVPRSTPGTINITGRDNTSLSPPLPSMACSVVGSCQIARRPNAPMVLKSAANAVVAMPDRAPAGIIPLFQDEKNPTTSNIEVAKSVKINDRVWKSGGGWSQSSAVRATKAPPNNSAGTTLLRTTNPSTCPMYQPSAALGPRL